MTSESEVSESISASTTDAPYIPDSASSHEIVITNFSQVFFPSIPDIFPPDSDISVTYVLTDVIEPSSRDWVGLFRVGWTSPRDYSTYVWAPKPGKADTSGNRSQSVTFQAYQLPGDDNEFYQFCYVTKQGSVRGASTPFQFRVSTENDCLVEVEDESGMIILKTRSDDLEEKLSQLQLEKESLQENFSKLNESKEALQKELEIVSETLSSTQDKLNTCDERNQDLQQQLDDAKEQYEKITKRLTKAESRIEQTKTQLAAAEATILALNGDIERLEKQMKEVESARDEDEQRHLEVANKKDLMIQEIESEKISLLDKIKDLTLIKDESQKKNASAKKEHEEALKATVHAKEELSVKMRRYRDERNLFKEQLTKSEIARHENLQSIESLTDQLDAAESRVKSTEEELQVKEDKIKKLTNDLEELDKKHQREVVKSQGILRTSMDQTNAITAAKQLLVSELSDVTVTRDQLLKELNQIKKEKESLNEELKGMRSTIHALQSQLETVEAKLEQSETFLNEHQRLVLEEKKKTEAVEQEMHSRIVTLQKQLEESDRVVAKATDSASSSGTVVPKSDRVTQTASENLENQSNETKQSSEEKDQTINELKSQIEDLTTRLGMGAAAYKDKYLECTKLEKKLRKMKHAAQNKEAAPGRATSPAPVAMPTKDEEEQSQGWRSRFEKLIMAIADPDAEEKEQALQLRQQLETLQKDLESEQEKNQKYKRQCSDLRKKLGFAAALSENREKEFKSSLKEAEDKTHTLMEENSMLKAQLKEFVKRSSDAAVRNVMTSQYSGSDEQGSSLDEGTCRYSTENPDEDLQFQDAPEVPMRGHSQSESSSEQTQSSSDDTEDYLLTQGAAFSNFNMCSESTGGGSKGGDKDGVASGRPSSSPKDIVQTSSRKEKVISRQPIRSPPSLDGLTASPTANKSETSTSPQTRKRSGKSGKNRSKGKGRKSTVKGVM